MYSSMATGNNNYWSVLRELNILCSSRRMDTHLAEKVKVTYTSIRAYRFPLIDAATLGLDHTVWDFIMSATMSNTDLHTDQTPLDLQKFLAYRYPSDGQTALHQAAWYGHFEVVKILLQYVSVEHLISYRNIHGYTPISWLKDPVCDYFIFETLKKAANGKPQVVNPSVSTFQDYEELEMAKTSYPTSYINATYFALDNYLNNSKCELTPNKNTILHLVSKFGDVGYTKSILEKHPSLVERRNSEGETPLYVAAREGNIDVLEILINHVKDDNLKFELATRSVDKHTALHIAIENHHAGVVFLLVKEIPKLANCVNYLYESPLYLAVERRYYDIFRLLLDECDEIGFEGTNEAEALNAAAILAAIAADAPVYIQDLLRKKIDLRIHNRHGWTPLHYAVFHNNLVATNALLTKDPNIGYQMTKTNGKNGSAVHIAIKQGYHDQINALYYYCPGCFEMIDSEGRNILHIAIEEKRIETFYFILNRLKSTDLINQRDCNGNTPFHLLAASDYQVSTVDYRANLYARNNKFLTPIDVVSSEEKRMKYIKAKEEADKGQEETRRLQREEEDRKRKEEEETRRLQREEEDRKRKEEERKRKQEEQEKEKRKQTVTKIGDNVVLVITLIATATFAAAFTVPGGFDGNEDSSTQGMPILLRKALYKAFVVSNAIAFSCSCCVLFGYVRLQLYNLAYDDLEEEDKEGYVNIINLQYLLTGIAMITMAVAFITGTYVILTPTLALAISLCATCVCIIVPFSIFPAKRLGFATSIISMFEKI